MVALGVQRGRSLGAALLIGALACALSSCGLIGDASNAYVAPIGVLPATDVAIQTNLQGALQQLQSYVLTNGSLTGFPSTFSSGASTGESDMSFFSPNGQTAVLADLNSVDHNCYAIVYLVGAASFPILGETSAGTYDVTDPGAATGTCSAQAFASETSAPTGWPAGDPSSSAFVNP